MLKSLLGYQSGMGCGASEAVVRKKVYDNAINNTLKNNFPLVLKVCSWCIQVHPRSLSVLLMVFCSPAGRGAGWKVDVVPRGSTHPAVCPPAGSVHEDRHPAGSGRALQRRRRCPLLLQEPRCGERNVGPRLVCLFLLRAFLSFFSFFFNYCYGSKKNLCLPRGRSGRRSGRASWTAPWKRAPVEKSTTITVRGWKLRSVIC